LYWSSAASSLSRQRHRRQPQR